MGPILAVKLFYKRAFDVTGRSRRSEYIFVSFFQLAVGISLCLLAFTIGQSGIYRNDSFNMFGMIVASVYGLFVIVNVIPWMTLSIRRFHDMGYTGWIVALFIGLYFIPFVGTLGAIIQFLWLFFGGGTAGNNAYGPDPRFQYRYAFE